MRKLLFAATALLISVSAHADPSYRVAADNSQPAQPVVITTEPATAPEASKATEPPKAVESAKAVEPTKAPEPAKASEPTKAAEPAKAGEPSPVAETKPVQVPKPKQRVSHRESDYDKARRIAAKYGVYW